MEQQSLVNRVEQSGIITIDLAYYLPKETIEPFDLRPFLVKDMVLMEKLFREEMKKIDWSKFSGKVVTVFCSNEALIPLWAYMLVASLLQPFAKRILFGNSNEAENALLMEAIQNLDASQFEGARVVIKGCGDKPLPSSAFLAITNKLQPLVQSLMYGEPCSAVPVYKKPKSS